MRKRTFKFISYFEKIFLVLFYKKGWFEESLAYLYRKNDIIDYRRDNHPLINYFHLYSERMDYPLIDLKMIVKQYDFYLNSKIFKTKLLKIFKKCFFIKKINFLKFLIIQRIFIKKYYNLFSSKFYKNYNNINLLKLNLIFNLFLLRAKHKFVLYDLNKWVD